MLEFLLKSDQERHQFLDEVFIKTTEEGLGYIDLEQLTAYFPYVKVNWITFKIHTRSMMCVTLGEARDSMLFSHVFVW